MNGVLEGSLNLGYSQYQLHVYAFKWDLSNDTIPPVIIYFHMHDKYHEFVIIIQLF